MARRYLDASVILPTLFEEARSADVDAFIQTTGEPLVISDFAAAEVSSAVSRLVRTGLLTLQDAQDRLADFDAWRAAATENVELQGSDARLANIYVRRFALMLRAPDAIHAAICRRTGFDLVALDKRLAVAARELGIRVHDIGRGVGT